MLTILILVSLLALFFLYLKLIRVKRRDEVLFAMCDYRREIMTFMRSERFNPEKISQEDYNSVRRALDISSQMIKIHSESYPATFHARNFLHFVRDFIKIAFDKNSELKKAKLSQNEEVKHLQTKLGDLVSWAVYYSTPRIFKISFITSFIIVLLTYVVKAMGAKYIERIFKVNIRDWAWFREFLRWINSISKPKQQFHSFN